MGNDKGTTRVPPTIGALIPGGDGFIVGDGASWLTKSGADARLALGFTDPILDKKAPGAIGGVTPAAGAFTTLSATGLTACGAGIALTGNLTIGGDVVLSRPAANWLEFASGDNLKFVDGYINMFRAATGNVGLDLRVTGDTQPRFKIQANGLMAWGIGAAAPDVSLYRGAANRLDLASGDSFNIASGSLLAGSTPVMDTGRNLINIAGITATGPITIDSPTNARTFIDRGSTGYEGAIYFRTAGANKAMIGLDNDATDKLHLAVGAAFTAANIVITIDDLKNTLFGGDLQAPKVRITVEGGIAVKLTNKTGESSLAGELVRPDTANDDAVILTGADDTECIGVFYEDGVADGAEAWVVVSGIADVMLEDTTAAASGNWVGTSGTAGRADATNGSPPAAPTHFLEIGHCIETIGAGTDVKARVVLHFN